MGSSNLKMELSDKEIGFFKRLADYTGFLAFYPFFSILAYGLDNLVLLFASEVFLAMIFLLLSMTIFKISHFRKIKRIRFLAFVFLASSVFMFSPFLFVFFFVLDPFVSVVGKLVGFVAVGLLTHSLSKSLRLGYNLDRFGGLIVFGSLILVVRDPLFVLAGLILISLGFGGVSNEIRKFYYAISFSLKRG